MASPLSPDVLGIRAPHSHAPGIGLQLLNACTKHEQLAAASCDDDWKNIYTGLHSEWVTALAYHVGALSLIAAAFAITPDAAFPPGTNARSVLAWATMAGGIGAPCCVYLLVWFPGEPSQFKARTQDFYGGYATFAIKAKVPLVCAAFSCVMLVVYSTLTIFRNHVFWVATVIAVVCAIIFSQYWTYGAHMGAKGFVRRLRVGWGALTQL